MHVRPGFDQSDDDEAAHVIADSNNTKVKESNHRNRKAKLATFFNDVRAAVYKACGISCL